MKRKNLQTIALRIGWACLAGYLAFLPYASVEKEEILEAAFREKSWPASRSQIVFLKVNDGDPSPQFLQKFKNFPATILPYSRSIIRHRSNFAGDYYYEDKFTGNQGSVIFLSFVRWRGPFKAEVEVAFKSSSSTFTFVRTMQGWFEDYNDFVGGWVT